MTGVCRDDRTGKWFARVSFRNKEYGLLRSDSQEEAQAAYNEAMEYQDSNPRTFRCAVKRIRAEHRAKMKERCASKYEGVTFNKHANKWRAYARDWKGKRKHLGTFNSEREAYRARKKFIEVMNG